jgi:hypothetical protein
VVIGFLSGLVALGSYMQFYPIYEPRHIFWAVSPGMGVFLFYVLRMARGRRVLVALALGTLLVPLGVAKFQLAHTKLAAEYVQIDDCPVLRGMSISPPVADLWRTAWHAIEGYCREHPDTAIVVYGVRPLFATFVPNLTNAHPFYIYASNYPVPPDLFPRREAFIRRFKPLVVTEGEGIEPLRPEMGYNYQKRNMINRFGYREFCTIPYIGTAILRPGP